MIRTRRITNEDKNKHLKIGEINLLRFDGATNYFSSQLILRIIFPSAGYMAYKTYVINFRYINHVLSSQIEIVEKTKIANDTIINLEAVRINDMVELYLKTPNSYVYNDGYVIQEIFENRSGYVDLQGWNACVDSLPEGEKLSVTDSTQTESQYHDITIIPVNNTELTNVVAKKWEKYISINARVTCHVTTGEIFSFDYQLTNITQYINAFNVTKKESVVLVGYANTKTVAITNLGGDINDGDILIINAGLYTYN